MRVQKAVMDHTGSTGCRFCSAVIWAVRFMRQPFFLPGMIAAGAIHTLSRRMRLYPANPIRISGNC